MFGAGCQFKATTTTKSGELLALTDNDPLAATRSGDHWVFADGVAIAKCINHDVAELLASSLSGQRCTITQPLAESILFAEDIAYSEGLSKYEYDKEYCTLLHNIGVWYPTLKDQKRWLPWEQYKCVAGQ